MTLVAIDGRAGAGKTTLAQQFLEQWSATNTVAVIHMDDLYDGWDNALGNKLTQSLETIVKAHLNREEFEIDVYNWSTMKFDTRRRIKPVDILILEGVGAGQKAVRDAGATLYWLDIEPEIGIKRVLARDGAQIIDQMKQWQIDQEIHFLGDKTRENAEHIQSSHA